MKPCFRLGECYDMDTRLLEPDVLYVLLPPEPQLRPEAALLRERLPQMRDMHLVLDLSRAEIVTSPSIGSFLLLQKQLTYRGRRLILCGARLATKCIFRVAGLDTLLTFAEDKFEAMSVLRGSPTNACES
jgi:anti-anti-sigma regulatory factor